MSNHKPWATLEKGGVHKRFATQQEARERAKVALEETGEWVGIEFHSRRFGWTMVDTVGTVGTAHRFTERVESRQETSTS